MYFTCFFYYCFELRSHYDAVKELYDSTIVLNSNRIANQYLNNYCK